MAGRTPEEMLKCDMIAEAVKDLLGYVSMLPFKRYPPASPAPAAATPAPPVELENVLKDMRDKWRFNASRFEAVLRGNSSSSSLPATPRDVGSLESYNATPGNLFLVGQGLSYADILVAHMATWYVEECGAEVLQGFPLLTQLQVQVISLPGVRAFIQSQLYFSPGGQVFADQVRRVLARDVR
jgi:hypothetical protein